MILAKFTKEEANNKSMQWKVSHNLHKKTKSKGNADATVATADLVLPVEGINFYGNKSPNNVSSMTEEELFSVNVAGHLTSNDMFFSGEKTWREKEKKRLMTEKNKCVRLMNIERR
jgi:hypothetical protein